MDDSLLVQVGDGVGEPHGLAFGEAQPSDRARAPRAMRQAA